MKMVLIGPRHAGLGGLAFRGTGVYMFFNIVALIREWVP